MVMRYAQDAAGNSNPYTNLTPEALTAFQQATPSYGPWSAQNYSDFNSEVGNYANNFKSQFENLVGRAPTEEEMGQFHQQYIVPNVKALTDPNSMMRQSPNSNIGQFVGTNFQKTAKDYALEQLRGQQDEATSLASLFRQQGNDAISATENSLLEYQSKLFDRLRPNLLTSLKSQGLLDTGGFNEAVAGVQGDLANNASNYIAGLKFQNEQGANAIAFGGANDPYQFQRQMIMNQPGELNAANANATGFNNDTFMQNLNYAHQLGLVDAQARAERSNRPSFMRTLGQGFAGSFGQNAGKIGDPTSLMKMYSMA